VNWFGAPKSRAWRKPTLTHGARVYAIGDVHGRLDLLRELLHRVEADDRTRPPAETHVIMLGDLVDRGPDSSAVIELLLDPPGFANFHFIMGNHEEAMLHSLVERVDPRETGWLEFGGLETLRSYGVSPDLLSLDRNVLARAICRHIPDEHLHFIMSFEPMIQFGDYIFVHAGIRPGIRLDQQYDVETRWIRAPFLDDTSDHGVVVVHGHSISPEPVIRRNRIGIDTGAYQSERLTALGLEGEERWFLRTEGEYALSPDDVVSSHH
jgi:serine/threonine protein phosphatase 1